MPELTTRGRERLRPSQFAYVDSHGGEHLPINDVSHVRNAMARWGQTDFESATSRDAARRRILKAAKSHGIEIDPDSDIARGKPGH